jgi:hypothetical protein
MKNLLEVIRQGGDPNGLTLLPAFSSDPNQNSDPAAINVAFLVKTE